MTQLIKRIVVRAIALTLLLTVATACREQQQKKDIVWTEQALTEALISSSGSRAYRTADGAEYIAPLVPGIGLSIPKTGAGFTLSYLLERPDADHLPNGAAQDLPLARAVAVDMQFGVYPGPAAPRAIEQGVVVTDGECQPSGDVLMSPPITGTEVVAAARPLTASWSTEHSVGTLTCSRIAKSKNDPFVLGCNGRARESFGTVSYNLATTTALQCQNIVSTILSIDRSVKNISIYLKRAQ